MTKPVAVVDTECYAHYWLLMAKLVGENRTIAIEMYEGKPLDVKSIRTLIERYTLVTFNGNAYDLPMIAYALTGANCDDLKRASDHIIETQMRAWDFEAAYNCKRPTCDHIDLIEVAPGQGSLKVYGGRLHVTELQDLPYHPDETIGPDEREQLKLYCGKDLANTEALYKKLEPSIELRALMSKEYDIDLRSKSDAQIAEAVIKQEVQKRLGSPVKAPRVPSGTTFKYRPPAWLQYSTPVMQQVFADVCAADFIVNAKGKVEEPPALQAKVAIGAGVYRLGIGGLHSSEQNTAHHADADTVIVDRDVASYYPAIVLLLGLYPQQMTKHFLDVYRGIVERRLEAKQKGKDAAKLGMEAAAKKWDGIAQTLKIVINGSFGKLGSRWSSLYSPDLMIQVTVTGQLALLMFIEMMESAGIPVISANTDGVVMKCPKHLVSVMDGIVKVWEQRTGFETEATEYRSLYSRDVNNYIAIKPDGKYKTKGAYASAGLQKNPTNTICVDAVAAFLTKGTPVEETILGCTDIRKFTTLRTVKGGGRWNVDGEYLGKCVRWYYSSTFAGVGSHIEYRSSGNKVARTDGCRPCMDLPDLLPEDIDYAWYVHEAYEILLDIAWRDRPPKLKATRKKAIAAEPKEEEKVE